MKCDQLFQTIDGLYERYLDVWEAVCNLESPTSDKAGVDAVGGYFQTVAEKKGWRVERFGGKTFGDVVCITMNPDVGAAPITFSGHMDTVHPVGSFGTPAVRREGDKIFGPGVTDCKGGLVAALLAMDALDRCGFRGRPVRLLLQSDEEGGSRPSNKATIRYICEKAKDSIAFLNLEGAKTGLACVERKGILTLDLNITGIEAHSSACATQGASAILEAAHKIIELEKFKDANGITANCGVIRGGTVHNTVPGFCTVRVNFRFATAAQRAEIFDFVEHLANTVFVTGCKTEIVEYGSRPAMELVDRNLNLLENMNAIFEANGLPRLCVSKGLGGSDAAQVTEAGIPCIDNLGVSGGGIHSPNEYANIASLSESAKRLASVAYCI